MYRSIRDHLKSRISPGSLIKVKMNLSGVPISAAATEWYYAIHMYDTVFYVITTEQVITLKDSTLLRAHLDGRLEIIEQ